jgi:hypothetical protein
MEENGRVDLVVHTTLASPKRRGSCALGAPPSPMPHMAATPRRAEGRSEATGFGQLRYSSESSP